ncbi:MAG TPA: helix-turn-helix transcriptional regulator [Polyangiaceae bacterium]|nr:helix-turn-helix transcriptional regulator [Polyangiaceae bacterium]
MRSSSTGVGTFSCERLRDVSVQFYDAILEPAAWPKAMKSLCHALDAAAGGIQLRRAPGAGAATSEESTSFYICSHGLDASCEKAYQEYYFLRDPWLNATSRQRTGDCYLSAQLIAAADLQRTDFYNDLCRPFDFSDWMGGVVLNDPGRCWIRVGLVARQFSGTQLEQLRLLMPHLARCVAIRRRVSCVEADAISVESVAQRLPFGVLFLDSSSRVVRANGIAERILSSGDGLCVTSGELRAVDRGAALALAQAIARVFGGSELRPDDCPCVTVPRASGEPPFKLVIVPTRVARDALADSRIRCVVHVIDPRRTLAPPDVLLRELFALTPAEARLAVQLARGKVPKEVAAELGLSWNTVRAQLRQVFAKTGTDRQASLVRLLASLALASPEADAGGPAGAEPPASGASRPRFSP